MPLSDSMTGAVAPAAAPAVSTTEGTNAKMLTQTMGKLVEVLGSGNVDVVAAIEAITGAITASIIGGTTGVTANRVLVSKGTGGFALQASPISVDPDTGIISDAQIGYGAFLVHRNGVDQTIAEDDTTVIDWTTATFDPDSVFNLTTNRYIPQVAGIYQITVSVYAPTGTIGETGYARIAVNDVTEARGAGFSETDPDIAVWISSVTALVYLNGSTDYIEGMVESVSGLTTLTGERARTYMCGHLVRAD